MTDNVLIIHEISYQASQVTSKRKLRSFEKWLKEIIVKYKDAAIEHYARIHLFQLREQFT